MMPENSQNEEMDVLSYKQLIWRNFKRNRLGVFGGIIVILLTLISLFAPFFSPYDYTKTDNNKAYSGFQKIRFVDEE